jgi:hypothetical protein
MKMIIPLAIGLCILIGVLGFSTGWRFGRKRSHQRRRGYLKVAFEYYTRGWNRATANVIVEELDRVATQSRVHIINIDDAPTEKAKDRVRTKIGKWWPTEDIVWDQPAQPKSDPTAEIIRTPMRDLIKQIEHENVREM